jgi:hypothetical protein
MTAATICLPRLSPVRKRSAKALRTGLQRIADTAGIWRMWRMCELPLSECHDAEIDFPNETRGDRVRRRLRAPWRCETH